MLTDLPYSNSFQNNFLIKFGKNTNIINFQAIENQAHMCITAYPIVPLEKVSYLPFRFMKYYLTYKYEN